jgi:hypothetical protein
VILVGEGCAEQHHDPVAHHPVDRALVAMHGFHHQVESGVENLAHLFWVTVSEQLHGAPGVAEEHRDLLALALQRGPGGDDLLGQGYTTRANGLGC